MAKPSPNPTPSKRDVKDATTIEPMALTEEFVRTPGDIAYWAGQYSDALEVQLLAEAERKRVKEEALLRLRKEAEAREEKTTEKAMAALVEVDPAYQAAVLAEIRADVAKSRVTGVLEAVRAKREMLVSLGAHIRQEKEIHIYEQQRKSRDR